MQLYAAALATAVGIAAAQTRPTYTALVDGVHVIGSVPYGGSDFYNLIVQLPVPRIDIVVIGLVGNPDLYVTTGPYWDPTPGNSEFASNGAFGSDVISIPFNSSVVAPGGFCRLPLWTNCSINVGVFGARASNYSLVVITSASNQDLVPGRPAPGSLPPGSTDYFNLTLPDTPSLTSFAVSPLDGAAAGASLSVFVSSGVMAGRPVPGDNSTYCASASAPATRSGVETVSIINGSACAASRFVVAVSNSGAVDTPDVAYTLLASTSASGETLLIDGTPAEGVSHEGGPLSLYVFTATFATSSSTLELVLTPSRGQAAMYVLLGQAPGVSPSPSNAAFVTAGGSGAQMLTIASTDPRIVAACGSNASLCAAHIGVAATSSSSAWSIRECAMTCFSYRSWW